MYSNAARLGDATTRGRIVSATSTMLDDNRLVALSGDKATCSECKGTFPIAGTGTDMSERGLPVVVSGDLVLCRCGRNRVLPSGNAGIFLESGSGASPHMAGATSTCTASPTASVASFDEQLRAIGRGLPEGYPYYIETADGRSYSGRLAADGRLPRIDTGAKADEYCVYWGDEALVKHGEA